MTQGAFPESAPIDDAAIQFAVFVPPEVCVVRIEVIVPEGDIVEVVVQPILDLRSVSGPSHHVIKEFVLERVGFDILREDHARGFGKEPNGLLQPSLHRRRSLVGGRRRIDAPRLRIVRIGRETSQAGPQHLLAAHLPALMQACDPSGGHHQQHVIILRGTPQLERVLALVVRALHFARRELPFADDLFAHLGIRDPRCDEDEVRSLVADIAIVILRCLHGERSLKQPIRVDLLHVHRLFVHRTANAVHLGLGRHRERHLGEQLGVQVRRRALVCDVEQEFARIVAGVDLDALLDCNAGHPVFFVQRPGRPEGTCQPCRAKVFQQGSGPWELQAVNHAWSASLVISQHHLRANWCPRDRRTGKLHTASQLRGLMRRALQQHIGQLFSELLPFAVGGGHLVGLGTPLRLARELGQTPARFSVEARSFVSQDLLLCGVQILPDFDTIAQRQVGGGTIDRQQPWTLDDVNVHDFCLDVHLASFRTTPRRLVGQKWPAGTPLVGALLTKRRPCTECQGHGAGRSGRGAADAATATST
mmetsp:Transcript_6958/g.19664  ORF Transcript_6958/g.19664 Transcript_6958/m.19664 type:complete len:533 (-) Transcript_6958:9-1607(-)